MKILATDCTDGTDRLKSLLAAAMVMAITVAFGGLLLPGTGDEVARGHITAMQADGSITNAVNIMVAEGVVCQIRGHRWETGCGVPGCCVIHHTPMRHCVICGKVETQEVGPWR